MAEDGGADVLAEEGGAGVVAGEEEAEADGDANEDLEDFGVDEEPLSESDEQSAEVVSKRELSLTPATHSQSTVLLRSRITLARM